MVKLGSILWSLIDNLLHAVENDVVFEIALVFVASVDWLL